MLHPDDDAYLTERDLLHTVVADGSGTHVILNGVPTPEGMTPDVVDILITLPSGYNDLGPDMFWCDPPVCRADGQTIAGTEVRQDIAGRTWQRWSRHIGGGWRPGIDNLASYIAYVKRAIADSSPKAA